MLRISKLTDYALLVVSQMAKSPEEILSASELAEALHLNTPTISKVLKMLAESEVVGSVRGADGGYHLLKAPQTISVVDVIRAMEGEFAMTECCESGSVCVIDSLCMMRGNWRKINQMVSGFLEKVSILDMLSPLTMQNGESGVGHDK